MTTVTRKTAVPERKRQNINPAKALEVELQVAKEKEETNTEVEDRRQNMKEKISNMFSMCFTLSV